MNTAWKPLWFPLEIFYYIRELERRRLWVTHVNWKWGPWVWTKPLPSDAKSPLPVDVLRSKPLLLKLLIVMILPKVSKAIPCRSLSTGLQCEMDPVSQTQASEDLAHQGLAVVGWYHSHPTFAPFPSVRDIETQAKFQVRNGALVPQEHHPDEAYRQLLRSGYSHGPLKARTA